MFGTFHPMVAPAAFVGKSRMLAVTGDRDSRKPPGAHTMAYLGRADMFRADMLRNAVRWQLIQHRQQFRCICGTHDKAGDLKVIFLRLITCCGVWPNAFTIAVRWHNTPPTLKIHEQHIKSMI